MEDKTQEIKEIIRPGNDHIVPIGDNIEDAIKAIGETIIDKAFEIAQDIEDVSKISICSSIEPDKVVDVEISKTYYAKRKVEWCKGKNMKKQYKK